MEIFRLCDSGCGKLATAFGLKNTEKVLCCSDHVHSLLSKQFIILGLDEYSFISSPGDVPISRARKAQVEKGMGNLTVLETACEAELIAALEIIGTQKSKVLRALEGRFEEIEAICKSKCNEAKQKLSELKGILARFLTSKENQLSPMAELICTNLSIIPRFLRFGISEVSDIISAVLSDCWTITDSDVNSTLRCLDGSQREKVIEDVLREAEDYAQKGMKTALQFVDLLIGDETQLVEEKSGVLLKLLEVEKEQIGKNVKWLQRSWDWRQRCGLAGKATVEVGENLAILLSSHLGKFTEAEQLLQHCYEDFVRENQFSVGPAALVNELCGVYFASARYQEAKVLGLGMLGTFGAVNLPAEYYRTAVFYIICSVWLQGKHYEGRVGIEEWRVRNLGKENKLAEMLRVLTSGVEAYINKNEEEARRLLLQTVRISTSYFPTSFFTAFAVSLLASVSEEDAQEHYHRQVHSIYEVAAPKSVHAARNLTFLGQLLFNRERFIEAEDCYHQAQSTYEIAAPMSIDAAHNLSNMGMMYQKTDRRDEASSCFEQALSIYNMTDLVSIQAARNLHYMGTVLRKITNGEWLRTAITWRNLSLKWLIQVQLTPQTTSTTWGFFCKNWRSGMRLLNVLVRQNQYTKLLLQCLYMQRKLYNLGVLHYKTQQWRDAEDYHRQAQFIFEVAAPSSVDAANNLNNMGVVFQNTDRWDEAEKYWRAAQSLYQIVAPRSVYAADNLHNIGLVFHHKQQFSEAQKYFREARLIYTEVAPSSLHAANNLNHIGVLCEKEKQWTEAEDCYRQAQSIYTAKAPKSVPAAHNFYNLGLLCKARQRITESMECFEKAEQIYTEKCNVEMLSQVQKSIAELRRIG